MNARPAPAATLVVGAEDVLVERAVADVVAAMRAGAGDGELDVREAPAAELAQGGLAALITPSLFEEAAVVVVRDLQDAAEHLVQEVAGYLADPPAQTALVLLHPGTAKGKKVLDGIRKAGGAALPEVACREPKSRRERLRFVTEEFRRARRHVTDEAVETLLDALGSDLRTLVGAAAQLVADTEGRIDADVVLRYYSGRAEVSGFTVADRTLEGRTADALEQLRWSLHSGNDPVPILAALAAGLRNVVAVASAPRGMSSADIARYAGIPPWKIDILRRQVSGWTPQALAAGFTALARADADIKGAATDPVYALERAVVVLSRARA